MLACSRAAGCTTKRYAIMQGLIACARGKNPPATTRNALRAHVQPGCTKKRYVIKPGLIACARGLNPPAIKKKICPRPSPDKTRRAEPGSHKKRTAQASKAAQVSVRDRDATSSVCRADTGTRDDRRDSECLDAY
ncbi:hypothetical protein PR003_g34001 [Phytophthora rubi]|uniref:Uncharacterized protein n=1 Tax=Phytophthora rubi TaxID=129364 RepID=A0A6A4AU48_9STRA|nr:hypothetical protein PR002_g32267 [Phytophthora rubi]KAE9261265.1 hypothetical protein PR003_g34001 [Phytophthora rubi]